MDTYLDRVVGDGVYEFYGRQFPLCVRLIRCRGRMPLRVHPDDETAAQRFDFLGKEKLWYVLRAGADARLMAGFRRDTDASEVYAKCLDGSVEGLLNVVAPHAGQVLRIPAGTPHAAAGDMEILEIGESSPMDFCLCGWGEEVHPDEFDPALTLVDALDFIHYRQFVSAAASSSRPASGNPIPGAELLVSLPQLHVERLPLAAPVQIRRELGPFLLYSCVRGAASVQLSQPGSTPSPGVSRAGAFQPGSMPSPGASRAGAFQPGGGSPGVSRPGGGSLPGASQSGAGASPSDDRCLDVTLRVGETVLVPAECAEFTLVPTERDTVLLESTVVPDDTDPYINPAAAPTLPDDD